MRIDMLQMLVCTCTQSNAISHSKHNTTSI